MKSKHYETVIPHQAVNERVWGLHSLLMELWICLLLSFPMELGLWDTHSCTDPNICLCTSAFDRGLRVYYRQMKPTRCSDVRVPWLNGYSSVVLHVVIGERSFWEKGNDEWVVNRIYNNVCSLYNLFLSWMKTINTLYSCAKVCNYDDGANRRIIFSWKDFDLFPPLTVF